MVAGSCHCGRVAFEVDSEVSEVNECNCSHCSRKGYLLWFVPRAQFKLTTIEDDYATYKFNKHVIDHHFCATCGCAPFATGTAPSGDQMAAVNVRCVNNIDLSTIKRIPIDGRSL